MWRNETQQSNPSPSKAATEEPAKQAKDGQLSQDKERNVTLRLRDQPNASNATFEFIDTKGQNSSTNIVWSIVHNLAGGPVAWLS
jgi:hypothetical protein